MARAGSSSTVPPPTFTELERRITAALQVNGRATWRQIATVLDEPERTVARQGSDLLASNRLRIACLSGHNAAAIVRVECGPASVRATATALAQRNDSVFVYALSGIPQCVAEIRVSTSRMPTLVLDELPSVIGVLRLRADPVLRVLRSVRQWRPLLTAAEAAALEAPPFDVQQPDGSEPPALSPTDRAICRVLQRDGRAPSSAVARAVGVTEATARRRLDWLQRNGHVWSRAVVEPAALGYPLEAVLWVRVRPEHTDAFAQLLLDEPRVREACALAGDFDLMVNVAVEGQTALHALIGSPAWRDKVQHVEVSVVLDAMKRSGVRVPLTDDEV